MAWLLPTWKCPNIHPPAPPQHLYLHLPLHLHGAIPHVVLTLMWIIIHWWIRCKIIIRWILGRNVRELISHNRMNTDSTEDVCIGANWMHELPTNMDESVDIVEEGKQKRLYSWLFLCDDRKISFTHCLTLLWLVVRYRDILPWVPWPVQRLRWSQSNAEQHHERLKTTFDLWSWRDGSTLLTNSSVYIKDRSRSSCTRYWGLEFTFLLLVWRLACRVLYCWEVSPSTGHFGMDVPSDCQNMLTWVSKMPSLMIWWACCLLQLNLC